MSISASEDGEDRFRESQGDEDWPGRFDVQFSPK